MAKDKDLNRDELEQTVRELQDRVRLLQERIDFFIHPLLISLCNDMKEGRPGVPRIMSWISGQFYTERDNARKRFLKDIHDNLRKTMSMNLESVPPLPPVVEEEIDYAVFER